MFTIHKGVFLDTPHHLVNICFHCPSMFLRCPLLL